MQAKSEVKIVPEIRQQNGNKVQPCGAIKGKIRISGQHVVGQIKGGQSGVVQRVDDEH